MNQNQIITDIPDGILTMSEVYEILEYAVKLQQFHTVVMDLKGRACVGANECRIDNKVIPSTTVSEDIWQHVKQVSEMLSGNAEGTVQGIYRLIDSKMSTPDYSDAMRYVMQHLNTSLMILATMYDRMKKLKLAKMKQHTNLSIEYGKTPEKYPIEFFATWHYGMFDRTDLTKIANDSFITSNYLYDRGHLIHQVCCNSIAKLKNIDDLKQVNLNLSQILTEIVPKSKEEEVKNTMIFLLQSNNMNLRHNVGSESQILADIKFE